MVVENVTPGSYQLTFSELNSFPEGTIVQLQDKFVNQTIPVENESSYTFTVTSSTATFGHDRFVIIISEPAKQIDIQINNNTLTVPFTEGIQWYFNGEAVSGATEPSFEADQSGLYEVRVSIDGCTYVGESELLVTGIESPLLSIKIYPNPVKDELIIDIPEAAQSIQVVLFNLLGQQCASQEIHQQGKVDMSNLPGGVYTIKITYGDQVMTKRIVKQ